MLERLVENDQVDTALGDLPQALFGRRGGHHAIAGPFEPKLLQSGDARIILHQQDRCPGLRFHGCSCPHGFS